MRLETRDLVAGSFLEDAPVVAVSARTGAGLDALRGVLSHLAATAPGAAPAWRRTNTVCQRTGSSLPANRAS